MEFDKRLGLKSATITFEKYHKEILSGFSALSVASWLIGGVNAGLGAPFYIGLMAVAGHYAWQMKNLDIRNPALCGKLFTSNKYLGLMLAFAIILGKVNMQ